MATLEAIAHSSSCKVMRFALHQRFSAIERRNNRVTVQPPGGLSRLQQRRSTNIALPRFQVNVRGKLHLPDPPSQCYPLLRVLHLVQPDVARSPHAIVTIKMDLHMRSIPRSTHEDGGLSMQSMEKLFDVSGKVAIVT